MAMLKPLLWPACIWPEVHHLFQTGISVLEWTRKTSVTSNRQAGCPHGKSQAFFFFPITVLSSIFFLWLGLDEHPYSFSPLLIVAPTSWSHLTTSTSIPTAEPHSPYQWFHLLPRFSRRQKPNLLLFPVEKDLLPIWFEFLPLYVGDASFWVMAF